MTDVTDRIGNVTWQLYEQLVTQAKELIAQIARSQFALGDMALEVEPMRSVGGSMPNGTDDLFTVTESLQMFADDIGVERRTVEKEFTEDERETVRRQIGRVRAAAGWLEGAFGKGEFTLDEQLVQLLKGE
ncbi:DUF6192 family protein [Streptomyces mirabilis]|uniref:DUF6192 family protein n=1 Tax=Streptomyces mirabilis TaxID=68239 RepID=UPI0033327204